MLNSPARRLLFGDHMLSTSFQIAGTDKTAQRNIPFSRGGTRIQTLVLASNSGLAGVDVSYSLNPLTQIGVSVPSMAGSEQLR